MLFLSDLLAYILVYKYIALFLICFISDFAIPVPATTTLVAMSVFASSGYISFTWTLVAGFLGSVLGDLTLYFLVRRYGRVVLKKLHLEKFFRSRYMSTAEKYIGKYPGLTIFWTRFVTALGPIVNVLGGLSDELSVFKFCIYDALGELTNILIFGFIGYYFGNQWQDFGSSITVIELGSVVGIIVMLFIFSGSKKQKIG